ncbi:transmembrane signal receptor [Lithospermum erythrorhizon]|uniref:Transmembrane signal receptor n=1 Tax=Lithospermum erythrorhizon TaxID=34254 RepID=A0AAV3PNS6_LITER
MADNNFTADSATSHTHNSPNNRPPSSPNPPFTPLNLPSLTHTLNVKNSVPIELTYTNYLNWKKIITKFLGSKKLLPLIDGTLPRPDDDHPQLENWIQCDDLVQSWIHATLSLPVLETLLNHDCTSATQVWDTLNQLFLDHAEPTRMNLCSKFQTFTKGQLTMTDFLQKIHSLYCSLRAVGEPLLETDLIAQILIGLPSAYAPFVTMMNNTRPMPSFGALRPMLLSEEERINILVPPSDINSIMVLYSSTNTQTPLSQPSNKGGSSYNRGRSSRGRFSSNRYTQSYRPRSGHFINYTPRPQYTRTDGILGPGPWAAPPLNTASQCQICKQHNHTAMECTQWFNHSYTSQIQSSFAAFNINEPPSDVWHPDSGASSHMTRNPSLLESVIPYSGSQKVMVGNGHLLHISNYVSSESVYSAAATPASAYASSTIIVPLESPTLWHRRLGHPGPTVLRRLVKNKTFDCSSVYNNTLCNVCELGKQSKMPFSSSNSVVSSPFALIHFDVWQSPIISPSGMCYYVIFIDQLTRYTWCYPMKNKSDTLAMFIQFYAYIQNTFNKPILTFQADEGGEFHKLESYFLSHGIHFRYSCPYTLQQNGTAERKNRHIGDKLRCLLFQAPQPTPPQPTPPQPTNTHAMTTRSKLGIVKPIQLLSLSTVSISPHPPIQPVPTCYTEAMKSPQWHTAMTAEYNALLKNKTWSLVPPHPSQNGFKQLPGIDYDQTFSPVIKPTAIRLILSQAISQHWPIRQLDVKNAFLNGTLAETVFLKQPPGFLHPDYPEHVCRLHKSLYGLKQAPRAWFQTFSSFLLGQGFVQSKADTSLFTFRSGSSLVYLLVYVDDIIITGSSSSLLSTIITRLNSTFSLTDLGPLSYFLGIQVQRSTDHLFLSQQKYITDLLLKYGFLQCNSISTPVSPRTNSHISDGAPLDNPSEYRQLVGALQYLCITRPDITYAVNLASQSMHAPTSVHMIAAKRILRYLSSTKSHGVVLRASPSVNLRVYSDSDWAGCPVSRRSTSSYCIFFGDKLLTWSSKKHVTVARSSTEAEYRCLASTVAELTWIQYLLCDLQISLAHAPIVYCDNIAATYLAYNPVMHSRTKYISLDYHFVREKVALGDLQVVHVPTHAQLADVFTKALSGPKF